jgi:excisionase family DNA binding protein
METERCPPDAKSKAKPGGTATYTIPQVAELLGISVRQVHRLRGELPGLLKLGASVRFAKAAIDGWLAGGK